MVFFLSILDCIFWVFGMLVMFRSVWSKCFWMIGFVRLSNDSNWNMVLFDLRMLLWWLILVLVVLLVMVRFVSVVVVFFFKFVMMEVMENKSCKSGGIILVLIKIFWLLGSVDRFFKVFRVVVFVFSFLMEIILINGGMVFCWVRVVLFWFVSFIWDNVFVIKIFVMFGFVKYK